MTGLSVSLSLKLTDSILMILVISQVPLCLFQKSTGSMEPVEPVLYDNPVFENVPFKLGYYYFKDVSLGNFLYPLFCH